jgi:hypothetical protein
MWLNKLSHGRLRVITDSGSRYVRLSFAERLRVAWVFRNFSILPQQVLSESERRWFLTLCSPQRTQRDNPEDVGCGWIGTLSTSQLMPSLRSSKGRNRSFA